MQVAVYLCMLSTSCHIIMFAINIYVHVTYKNMYMNIINCDSLPISTPLSVGYEID